MGLLPVAAWQAMACVSGGGLGSCVGPDFDERCSTHRKSTHPCSPRPSEALRGKRKPQSENHDTCSDLIGELQLIKDVIEGVAESAKYGIPQLSQV